MSNTMRFDLTVTYDDGTTETVKAGQRELACWEREPFGGPSTDLETKPVLIFRYLAYAALRRTWRLEHIDGKPASFEDWDDLVDSVDMEGDDDADADPTKTAPLTAA